MSGRMEQLLSMWEADASDADIPYMIAQEHLVAGQEEAALLWFDRCLGIDAAYHYAYYHRAKALEALERLDEARATLQLGLEASRRDGNAQAIGEIEAYLDELD